MIRAPIACLALAAAASAQSLNFARFDYPAGQSPTRAAIGDFDLDGRPDVAVASAAAGAVSILHGQGAGVLGAPVVVGSPAPGVLGLAVGDFDVDGDLDLASAGGTPGVVLVLRNDGTTPFAALPPIPVGAGPRWIEAADFDGAGGTDLSTSNFGGMSLSVILSTAGGVLVPATNYALGTEGLNHDVADVDQDGDLDVVAGRRLAFEVTKLANDGLGAFGPDATGTGLWGWAEWVALGDFTGDAVPDLVTPTNDFLEILTEVYKGHVAFGYQIQSPLGYAMSQPRLELLDGDSLRDAVIPSLSTVAFHLADGLGGMPFEIQVKLGGAVSPAAVADLDADGLLDVAVTVASAHEVSVLLQTAPAPPTITGTAPASLAVLTAGPQTLAIAGSGFTTLKTAKVAGATVAATVEEDGEVSVAMPNPLPGIGSESVELTNDFGSVSVLVPVVAAPAPTLHIVNASGMHGLAKLRIASDPGELAFAAASLDLLPSSLPGLVDLGIGNGFASLVQLGAVVIPAQGFERLDIPFSGIVFGTQIHFQFAALDVPPALPLVASNVATGTVLP